LSYTVYKEKEVKTGKCVLITTAIVFALTLSACPPIDEDEGGGDIITLTYNKPLDGNTWSNIVFDVAHAKGNVKLDLKDCTYVEGNTNGGLVKVTVDDGSLNTPEYIAFDPNPFLTMGKEKVISIVLPDDTQMVNQAIYDKDIELTTITEENARKTAAFLYFENLRSVSGANVVLIGNYAFAGCGSLRDVNFPRVGHKADDQERQDSYDNMFNGYPVDIGHYAFQDCAALTETIFNAAAVIGIGSFKGCTSLRKISFPQVWHIGDNAFENCRNLTEIRFETAATIGNAAFKGCSKIKNAYFDAKPLRDPLNTSPNYDEYDSLVFGSYTFSGCRALEKLDVRNAWNVFFHDSALENTGSKIEIYLYDDNLSVSPQISWGHPQTATTKMLGEGTAVSIREVKLIVPKLPLYIESNIKQHIKDNYPEVDVNSNERNI
jgi:hypothetical protein